MSAADRLIGKAHDYEVLAASHTEREALVGGREHLAAATAFIPNRRAATVRRQERSDKLVWETGSEGRRPGGRRLDSSCAPSRLRRRVPHEASGRARIAPCADEPLARRHDSGVPPS